MTTYPMRAKVECTDGPDGVLVAVIIDPARQQVTHLVVHHRGEQRLVPVAQVASASGRIIYLHCSDAEMQMMELFVEKRLVRLEHPETPHCMAYQFPLGVPPGHSPYGVPAETDIFLKEVEHVPKGELVLYRGAPVEATDGMIGHVTELRVARDDNHITHLVTQSRTFLRKRARSLPLTAVGHFEDDAVYLRWDRHTVDELPSQL